MCFSEQDSEIKWELDQCHNNKVSHG
jgi:hypothetical protein